MALYFDAVHKLTFLSQMLPRSSLNKDLRLIQIETFYQYLFAANSKPGINDSQSRSETVTSAGIAKDKGSQKKGLQMKLEIGKLIIGSKDVIFASGSGANMASNISILKNTTYEKLNQ